MINNTPCSSNLLSENEMLSTPGIVAWKDINLVYLGASKNMITKFGFHDLDDVIGSTVYDIKCPMVACAEQFIMQDTKVINEKTTITVLDIHPFADGVSKILLGNRAPFIDHDTKQLIGTVYTGIEISNESISILLNLIIQSEKPYYGKNMQRSYTLKGNNNDILTEQEKECLFYLLHGFTAKHTGQKMQLSHRTVENHLASIKRKFNCSFKNELIDKAIELGYLSYIPMNILTRNISLEL